MEVDARTLDQHLLETDLCIVGAGPAGLALARELIGANVEVVLLESGDLRPDRDTQALCNGSTSGDAYADPAHTRHRQAGGTANIWNTWLGAERIAKYVPLDPIDFEERTWLPHSGWPFEKRALDSHFERAQSLCGLGLATYHGDDWAGLERPALPLVTGRLTTNVFQLGPARLFTKTYLDEVRGASNIRLCLNATVVELETDPSGRSITQARVTGLAGHQLRVRATVFVLASGGIENARLLLLSNRAWPNGLGNHSDLVGRCFMDHPRDISRALVPNDPALLERSDLYDLNQTPLGIAIGRLALTDQAMRDEKLLSMSVKLRRRAGHPRRSIWQAEWPRRLVRIGRKLRPDSGSLAAGNSHGRYTHFQLQISLEQSPDPNNRVTLARGRDALGLPKVEIQWRWRDADRRNHARVVSILEEEVVRARIGRIVPLSDGSLDPNAHHHMGATRMHRDPARGVVDENARVHGLSNLFIAGSSVFPTSGFANPTLTIVALTLRLADHVKELLGAVRAAGAIAPGVSEVANGGLAAK